MLSNHINHYRTVEDGNAAVSLNKFFLAKLISFGENWLDWEKLRKMFAKLRRNLGKSV